MRVLYWIPRYWPSVGGAQVASTEIIRRMSAYHAVEVITQFTSDRDSYIDSVVTAAAGEYRDGAIRVHRIGPTGFWRSLLSALGKWYGRFRPVNPLFAFVLDLAIAPQVMRIAGQFQPEILHAVHIGLVYSSETACRVAHRLKIPFIWTPFPHIQGDSGWRGRRFRRLYRSADALIAMTRREKDWLVEQGAAAERVHVVPVGPLVCPEYDAAKFRQDHGLGQDPVVLFLAQKLPYKGYMQMVEAAPLVWTRLPETRFLFVGPRTAESERFFAGVNDPRIVELPAVSPYEKSSALAACDVFCMPSLQESLGVVYLEAWRFRKPVIAANIDIAREVIEHGQNGLLVEQEPQSIAQAILELLADKAERDRMGDAGFAKVGECYDWDRSVGELVRVYQRLMRSA